MFAATIPPVIGIRGGYVPDINAALENIEATGHEWRKETFHVARVYPGFNCLPSKAVEYSHPRNSEPAGYQVFILYHPNALITEELVSPTLSQSRRTLLEIPEGYNRADMKLVDKAGILGVFWVKTK